MEDKRAYEQCIDNITHLQGQLQAEEERLFGIMAQFKNRPTERAATRINEIRNAAVQIAC